MDKKYKATDLSTLYIPVYGKAIGRQTSNDNIFWSILFSRHTCEMINQYKAEKTGTIYLAKVFTHELD